MFPAYSGCTSSLAHGKRVDPAENEMGEKYSSFMGSKSPAFYASSEDREMRFLEKSEKRKKRRNDDKKKHRSSSRHSKKVRAIHPVDGGNSSSLVRDSCSSKKEKRTKKKAKRMKLKGEMECRKSRRRSSSSSSASSHSSSTSDSLSKSKHYRCETSRKSKEKWSFMMDFDPSKPSSFFVMDCKADGSNFIYNSLHKSEVACYQTKCRSVFEGCVILNKMFFPEVEAARNKTQRYFDKKVMRSWNNNPERLWRKKPFDSATSFIELSTSALTESDLQDESGKIDVKKCESIHGGSSLIDADPHTESLLTNTRLGKDKNNISLWLKFIALQDDVYMSHCDPLQDGRSRCERLTDKDLIDRKLAILDKALSFNPDSIKLKIERLRIGRLLWEDVAFDHELRLVEIANGNDSLFWESVFDLIENDARRFKTEFLMEKMRKCMNTMSEILIGQSESYSLHPDTEQFLARLTCRRIRFLLHTGFTEKAVASAQAVCEFNFCMPSFNQEASIGFRRTAFETFWDSGIARIGDANAIGWANSIGENRSKSVQGDEDEFKEEMTVYEKLEEDLCRNHGPNGSRWPHWRIWYHLEMLRSEKLWRPIRSLGCDVEDFERIVTFDDIQDLLIPFSRLVAIDMMYNILMEFGGCVYGHVALSSASIMDRFEVFPRFQNSLNCDFVDRFFQCIAGYIPENLNRLLSSWLITCFQFIKNNDKLDKKGKVKIFRSQAKRITKESNNMMNITLMATYAEKMLELGELVQVKAVAMKVLSERSSIWKTENSDFLISSLRLILCYVRACDVNEQIRVLANIAANGNIARDENIEPRLAEKCFNTRIMNFSECEMTDHWEGSVADLLTVLALIYAYRQHSQEQRLNLLARVIKDVRSHVQLCKRPQFMKTYLDLLYEYCHQYYDQSREHLRDQFKEAILTFPMDVDLLKKYIDLSAFGIHLIHLRRFLEEKTNDPNIEICRAYATVYLELLRYRILLEQADAYCPELHRLRVVLESSSERLLHKDDSFWRIYLHIESERKDVKRAAQVFYLAYANCPWSRSLICDYVKCGAEPAAFTNTIAVMTEKGLRARCQPDEISILLDFMLRESMAANFGTTIEINPDGSLITRQEFTNNSIVILHVAFRLGAIVFYLFAYAFTDSFIAQFLIILILCSFDFWIVKNITGRLLVRLRWWNFVDRDGRSQWRFESAKDLTSYNAMEGRVFWLVLTITPLVWALFTSIAFFTFKWEWMVVTLIGFTMTGANLFGYLRCKWNSADDFSNALSKWAFLSVLKRSKMAQESTYSAEDQYS